MEVRRLTQSQARLSDEVAALKLRVNSAQSDLKDTSNSLSAKDGLALTLEKDIKRLKANLKLSQNENDMCQKRLEDSTCEVNRRKSEQLAAEKAAQQLKRKLLEAQRNPLVGKHKPL